MKNKEPKKKWTGKKQIWYGAAGLFCLVAAVLVLILGNGMGAQAGSLCVWETKPWISPWIVRIIIMKSRIVPSCLHLEMQQQTKTKDKNFKLVKDLKISSITAAIYRYFCGNV